jgi:hypothetical protein
MDAREETASALFKLIGTRLSEMAMLFEALADPDRGSVQPETPQEKAVGRKKLTMTELGDCAAAGEHARHECMEAGGEPEVCYAAGVLANADCIRDKLKEPEKKAEG